LRVYIDEIEYSQILAAMTALQPRRLLEWGSGGSTVDFLRRFASIEKMVSVEHDPDWFAKTKAAARDPRLSIALVRAASPEPRKTAFGLYAGARAAWRERAERDRSLFGDYVDYPATLGLSFDCIFVDGRARNFCIGAGFALLERGGLMIIHDAQRDIYRAAIARHGTPTYLAPYRRGQVCLLPKP
jgi:predicted O-methyltransferase YrrM